MLYPKPCYNEPCYKEVEVYIGAFFNQKYEIFSIFWKRKQNKKNTLWYSLVLLMSTHKYVFMRKSEKYFSYMLLTEAVQTVDPDEISQNKPSSY